MSADTHASGVVVGEGAGGWVGAEVRVRGTESDVEHTHRLRRAFRLRTDDGTEYEVECGDAEVEGGSTLDVRGTWGELREGPHGALLGEFSAAPSFPLQLEAEGVRAGDYVRVEGASELRASELGASELGASELGASDQAAEGSEKGYRQAASSERTIVAERIAAAEPRVTRSSTWVSSPVARHGLTALLVALAIAPWFIFGLAVHPVGAVVRGALSCYFALVVCVRLLMEAGYPHAFPKSVRFFPFPQSAYATGDSSTFHAGIAAGWTFRAFMIITLVLSQALGWMGIWCWTHPESWEQGGVLATVDGPTSAACICLIALGMSLWPTFEMHRLYDKVMRVFLRHITPLNRSVAGWRVTEGEVTSALARIATKGLRERGEDKPSEPELVERHEGPERLVLRREAGELAVDLTDAISISWLPAAVEPTRFVGTKDEVEIRYRVPAGARALVAAYGEQGEHEWKSVGPEGLVIAFGPPGQDLRRLVRRSRWMAYAPYLVTLLLIGLTSAAVLWTMLR